MSLKNSVFLSGLFSVMLAAQAAPVIDPQLLWLPMSYKTYKPELRKAAELVQMKAPNCAKVVQAGLALDQSTLEAPIFKVTCRDANQRTNALLIDGLTLEVVDPDYPGGRVTFEQLEKEKARLAAEQERLKALELHNQLRDDCHQQLLKRTTKMRKLHWWTVFAEATPAAEVGDDDWVRFQADFDAVDIYAQPLKYRAVCAYHPEQKSQISIKSRR